MNFREKKSAKTVFFSFFYGIIVGETTQTHFAKEKGGLYAKRPKIRERDMRKQGIRINREIEDGVFETILRKKTELFGDEQVVFIIVSDLKHDAFYGSEYFAATDAHALTVDGEGNLIAKVAFADLENAEVRRMYGNARLCGETKDGEKLELLRFTYATAALGDMAAEYMKSIAEGETTAHAIDAADAAFEKAISVCPRCGRKLLHPGAECIGCQSKGKIASKLIVYVKPEVKNLILCLFLSLIATALSMLRPSLTATLVDTVIPNSDTRLLGIVVLLLLGAYILQNLVGIVRSYRLRCTAVNIVTALRNHLYEKAQHLSMRFYDKTSTGSVINRISGDSNTIEQFMVRLSQEVVVQFFTMIGIVVIMFAMNWKLALITLLPIPFIVTGSRIFGKKILPFYRKVWRKWASVTSYLTDTIPAIRVTKAFSNEDRTGGGFAEATGAWAAVEYKSARISTAFPNIVSFFVNCGHLLIWSIGGAWVIFSQQASSNAITFFGGRVTVGTLVAFISYATMFYTPVNFFATFNDSYQNALSSAERILDILDADDEPDAGRGNCPAMVGQIEFKDVSFSFDRTKMTLSHINCTIEPGDVVGIVGTTGAGKSTLVNLLMRFYDEYEGEILVDGNDIRNIDLSYYRSQLGYVQQESIMFRDTVFHNLAFGKPDATVEEVFHAAEIANAHEFIARLPDGYDTMLGERGIGLSGGERQRLSIARTVLMEPQILIFDEATASVDSETESQIQAAIERLIAGRTTLMIAHRLSTLRKANKIIVLDRGKILEMGTPEELLAAKGKYYKLIQIQTMAEKAESEREEERL